LVVEAAGCMVGAQVVGTYCMVNMRVEVGREEAAHTEFEVAGCTMTARVVAGMHSMTSTKVEAGLAEAERTELEVAEGGDSRGKELRPKAQHARRTREHGTSSDR
jgi:hypothetical protein